MKISTGFIYMELLYYILKRSARQQKTAEGRFFVRLPGFVLRNTFHQSSFENISYYLSS